MTPHRHVTRRLAQTLRPPDGRGVEDEVVAANPDKYIEYTDGNWDFNNGIDGGEFFVKPEEIPAE